ncbi:MAG TPA: DNA repair protein RecN [Limnochordia bacterium]
MTVENFALIDRIELEFGPGLNVLTGETGAGKSILLGAVAAALGERVGGDLVRTGEETARIEAVFSVDGRRELHASLAELGVEPEEGRIWLGREISKNGRNKARLNGRLVPAQVLAELGRWLVDIHGQHEHQSLLRPESHLDLLDALGGPSQRALTAEVASLWQKWSELAKQLAVLAGRNAERAQREEWLRFQIAEIDEAKLKPGEREALTREREILTQAERLQADAGAAYSALYESDPTRRAAVEALGDAIQALRGALRLDPRLEAIAAMLDGALSQAQEAAHDLRRYLDEVRADPARLEEVERRLLTIERLERKYGGDIANVLAHRERAALELAELGEGEARLAELTKEAEQLASRYAEAAAALSEQRAKTAHRLTESIKEILAELGMRDAQLIVRFEPQLAADSRTPPPGGDRGRERAEFLFSANRGEPPRPLARTASGGELSRIMLALRQLLSDGIPTLIFDEIDTGIGGRTAIAVADRLSRLAERHQILCVTHLPQIAACAPTHFAITKETSAEHTCVRVERLRGEARILELARMLGGTRSAITVQHAREMIAQAALRQTPSA